MLVKFSNTLFNKINNGVKQGGVLSPILFTVYIDNLIKILKQRNIGCKISNKWLEVLGYADDLTLLCPSSPMKQYINNTTDVSFIEV